MLEAVMDAKKEAEDGKRERRKEEEKDTVLA